jgi:dihydroflavonol-4-reductase
MARIAVTGASGLLGANLVEQLLAGGHHVVATRRRSTKLTHLDDLDVEWRTADLGDVDSLARAFAGVEAVFHCAAAVSVRKDITPEVEDTNVAGTRRVVAALRQAGRARLIHTSSIVTIGPSGDGTPCDETTPWRYPDVGLGDAYALTKQRAEQEVLAAVRDGLDAVIVNPTYMFGPRDARPSSGKLLLDVAQRKVPGWTPGRNNFVDARAVARGMIAAWQRGGVGERYILGGHELTYRELFELGARLAGVAPPRFGLPHALARVAGWWGDRLEQRGGDPVITSTRVRYAYSDRLRYSSAKAERELGYRSGPLEPALTDALAWFRAHGML